MLVTILRHEWRVLRSDNTLWLIAVVFAGAIAYGVWNGMSWVAFERDTITAAREEQAERYVQAERQIAALAAGGTISAFADPRNPTNVGSRLGPKYAVLPPGPLAATSIGQSDLLPYYLRISTEARETLLAAAEVQNPLRLLVGRFDLAFVIVYLFPLLILAVTYNMLSGEKEDGTLALAVSQPVSLGTLVTGKVLLRGLALGGLVVVFSIVAIALSGTSLAEPGVPARLALWTMTIAAYGALWLAVAVFVCARGMGSSSTATVLASSWLVWVLLVPSTLNMVVTAVYPVPSRVELVQAMREASDAATEAGSLLLARYYEDHPELAVGDAAQAMNDANVIRLAVADDVERRVRPVVSRFERQLALQEEAVGRMRFLSPAVLVQEVLNDVAGTGTARHQDFMAQVDAYHRTWRAYFTPLIVAKARLTDYSTIPDFDYREESLSTLTGRVARSLAGLLLPAVCLAWLGWRRLKRYPVVG